MLEKMFFFTFKCFFIANFVPEGSRFLSPGVHTSMGHTTIKLKKILITNWTELCTKGE
jgi:hypothetical protein